MESVERFLDFFSVDDGHSPIDAAALKEKDLTTTAILSTLGGRSFNSGLLRFFTPSAADQWNESIGSIFPGANGIIECFAFGWDGRVLATTTSTQGDPVPGIFIFDPSTADCLSAPTGLRELLNSDLLDEDLDLLDSKGLKRWLKAKNPAPAFDECVGYDVPLFMDGKDSLKNRSITDLAVYWELTGELIEQTGILES